MVQEVDVAKKRVVLAFAVVLLLALCFNTLPGMAAKHGMPPVLVTTLFSLFAAGVVVNVAASVKAWREARQHND